MSMKSIWMTPLIAVITFTQRKSTRSADGGIAQSYYLCETCNTIVSHMRWDDEYGFGELREEALKIERETTNVNQQKDPRCGVQEI